VSAYLPRGEGGASDAGAGDDECICALTAATPLDRSDAAALTPDGALDVPGLVHCALLSWAS
jgi:hypothetical protein